MRSHLMMLVAALALCGTVSGQYLYWHDNNLQELQRTHVNGTGPIETVLTTNMTIFDVRIDTLHQTAYCDAPGPAWKFTLTGAGTQLPFSMDGFDIDPAAGLLYHGVFSQGIVARDLNGNAPQTVIPSTISSVTTVRVDRLASKIYWLRWQTGIYRANLDGTGTELVVPISPGSSREFAIDRTHQWLFYSDGSNLMRANTDGTNVVMLAPLSGITVFRGFACDEDTETVYWIEPLNHRIRKVQADGSGIATVRGVPTSANFEYLELARPTKLDATFSCTPGSSSGIDLSVRITGGNPGSRYFLPMAVFLANTAPNGWFYGINITPDELMAQLSSPTVPFLGTLDTSGSATITVPSAQGSCPYNLTLDTVPLEFTQSGIFIQAGEPRTVSL